MAFSSGCRKNVLPSLVYRVNGYVTTTQVRTSMLSNLASHRDTIVLTVCNILMILPVILVQQHSLQGVG